ncbi:RNA guanylyltransferase and 5'-phosphatase mRNA capping enzyme [Brevipalpus obovatus]|uniref:RNA guanylyltransferase and 5'-phosphatase mRNA capping enzyme n=1 Tax=Brevipalpus obovatus TaxID=246614 RepID=UPI003D9F7630
MANREGGGGGNIPPRWLNCPRHSDLIAEKFYAIKTPLDGNCLNHLAPANYWTPKMALKCFKNLNIGLWIDLTNTSRYYSKGTIESNGLSYVKLECRGHGECPSKDQTSVFIDVCQKFFSLNPLKKIVVHCTHGFNRSGFLICAFLVEQHDWSIDASVSEFSKQRPPGIYKRHYLEELFSRYGDPDDMTPPPPLPEWCFEEKTDDLNGDDLSGNRLDYPSESTNNGNNNNNHGNRKDSFSKNHANKSTSFMKGVEGVTPVDAETQKQVQRKCVEYCGWTGKGFPGCQPVSMDQSNMNFIWKNPYKVSWKADGTRYLMLIDGPDRVFFVDRDNNVFHAKGVRFPRKRDEMNDLTATLVDGEMIIDEFNGEKIPRYLIYDIIKFENKDVGGCDFNRRMQCIKLEIIEPREVAKKQGIIDRGKEPFGVRVKDFWEIFSTRSLLSPSFSAKLSHEIDGLIFQPEKDPYKPGQCPEVLKWKPPTHNSVDFRLHVNVINRPGCPTEKVGYLYVGQYFEPFAQIRYNKDIRGLDKKIIECTFDYNAGEWKFMRVRTDKSFPNSYNTAMAVFESIKNPVTKELLLNEIDKLDMELKNRNRVPQTQHPHSLNHHTPQSIQSHTANSSQKRPHPDAHRSDSQSINNNDRNLMPPPPVMRKVA